LLRIDLSIGGLLCCSLGREIVAVGFLALTNGIRGFAFGDDATLRFVVGASLVLSFAVGAKRPRSG